MSISLLTFFLSTTTLMLSIFSTPLSPGKKYWQASYWEIDKLCNDIVEAHCYFVDIGRTDREQIRSRINNNDCRTFCTQLTKAFVAETSCNHCY